MRLLPIHSKTKFKCRALFFGAAALSFGSCQVRIQGEIVEYVPSPLTINDGVPTGSHRIFTTSSNYLSGIDFTSISDASQICNTEAQSVGLKRNYVALLSDGTTDLRDQITTSAPVYVYTSTGAEIIALSKNDLFDNSIFRSVSTTANGTSLAGDPALFVFTGSLANGTKAVLHCSSWTNSTGTANYDSGSLNAVDQNWLYTTLVADCDSAARLYCITSSI